MILTSLNIIPLNKFFYWINILKISSFDYMLYMFLPRMPNFMQIECYLLFDQ